MLETLHRVGSGVRHMPFLTNQQWIWQGVEPIWQRAFARATAHRGYMARVNGDQFRLTYAYAARYDRADQQVYEPESYHAFVSCVAEGMTIFDIGAHIGIFTLGAASRVGRAGRVYAFEAAPASAELLRRHIELNGWADRAEAVEAVASDTNGTVDFYTFGESMSASLGRYNVEVLNPQRRHGKIAARRINARSVTLDQFAAARGLRPTLLKIDVEGAELRVLRGARRLLEQGDLVVLCEIHPRQLEHCGSSLEELSDYLRSVGYALETLDRPNDADPDIFNALLHKGG